MSPGVLSRRRLEWTLARMTTWSVCHWSKGKVQRTRTPALSLCSLQLFVLCSFLCWVACHDYNKRPEANNLSDKNSLSSWFGRFQCKSGPLPLGLQGGALCDGGRKYRHRTFLTARRQRHQERDCCLQHPLGTRPSDTSF